MTVVVVEHKTTSEEIALGSPYWKRLELDAQVTKYLGGARALGYDPQHVLYDVIRKPRIRPMLATPVEARKYTLEKSKACPECKKKSAAPGPHRIETVDEEDGSISVRECVEGRIVTDPGGRLYANMREFDETAEEFRLRLRADIAENPDEYYRRGEIPRTDEEERDAAADEWAVGLQIRESQRSGRWSRNTAACKTWGKFCEFFDVCTKTTSINDPYRYRDSDGHEELEDGKEFVGAPRRLPLLTHSSVATYRTCQRKYQYLYELKRRSVETSDALRFGTLIHLGLEAWWKTVDLDAAFAAMAGESDPFERVKAEELLRGYHVRWRNEPIETLEVEKKFVAPLVNPDTGAESKTWQRGGKMDAIARVS